MKGPILSVSFFKNNVRFSCLPTLFGDKWNDEWVGSVNRGEGDEKNQR